MSNEIKLQLLDRLIAIAQFGKEAVETDMSESAIIDKLLLLRDIRNISLQNEDLRQIYAIDLREVASIVYRMI